MKTLEFLARTYSVSLDSTSFRAEPDATSGGTPMLLCRVGLTGNCDLRWQKSFYFTQWDSIENFFYRLSKDGTSVCFLSPINEAAENVKLRLRALSSFLNLVNSNSNRNLGAHSDWSEFAIEPEFALTA